MFSDIKYRIGRESSLLTLFTKLILTFFNYCYLGEFPFPPISKSLRKGIPILFAPAIITGCSKSVFPQTEEVVTPHLSSKSISISHFGYGSTLDILTFNDDRLQRLDSYQRIEDFDGSSLHAESTEGDKIIFLYSGSQKGLYSWADICSYSSLRKIKCDLEKETRESPSMTGVCRCNAGTQGVELEMTPLTCEIIVGHLKCDFSGKPYAGESIHNAKFYLTNVNATSSLLEDSTSQTTRLINTGLLNEYDIRNFRDRSMIVQNAGTELTEGGTHLDTPLLCYSNKGDTTRNTRLVIEGEIEGEKYYWPIEVNNGKGVYRGHRYIYNITIRRKGVSDPDSILEPLAADIKFDIRKWQEKEEYQVGF